MLVIRGNSCGGGESPLFLGGQVSLPAGGCSLHNWCTAPLRTHLLGLHHLQAVAVARPPAAARRRPAALAAFATRPEARQLARPAGRRPSSLWLAGAGQDRPRPHGPVSSRADHHPAPGVVQDRNAASCSPRHAEDLPACTADAFKPGGVLRQAELYVHELLDLPLLFQRHEGQGRHTAGGGQGHLMMSRDTMTNAVLSATLNGPTLLELLVGAADAG